MSSSEIRRCLIADAAGGTPMQPTVLVYTTRSTPAFLRGFEEVAGAFDIRAVKLLGIFGPQPVIGRDMKDQAVHPATARSREAGSRRSPVTVSTARSSTWLPGRTRARTLSPRSMRSVGDVPPEKAGGSGD